MKKDLEIKDGMMALDLEGTSVPPATSTEIISLLQTLSVLIETIPLADYTVQRVGSTNVWNVTATAKDARLYATTITITDDIRYTLTSFPAGTAKEVGLLLAFVGSVSVLLVPHEIESLDISWT